MNAVIDPYAWDRARAIAAAALSGDVYRPVGLALNYHASAIRPYWAPSLEPQRVVGAHVFYRRPGSSTLDAFSQAPAEDEPDGPRPPRSAAARQVARPMRASYEPMPVLEIPVVERPVLFRTSDSRRPSASGARRPQPRAATTRSGPRVTIQGGVRVSRGS